METERVSNAELAKSIEAERAGLLEYRKAAPKEEWPRIAAVMASFDEMLEELYSANWAQSNWE